MVRYGPRRVVRSPVVDCSLPPSKPLNQPNDSKAYCHEAENDDCPNVCDVCHGVVFLSFLPAFWLFCYPVMPDNSTHTPPSPALSSGDLMGNDGEGRVCLNHRRRGLANGHSHPIKVAILAGDTRSDTRRRLNELLAVLPSSALAAVLSVRVGFLNSAMAGRWHPQASFRRLVWFVWTLYFEPTRCRTWFDVVSWGKFRPPPRPVTKPRPVIPWRSR